jgi:hypothetical protein
LFERLRNARVHEFFDGRDVDLEQIGGFILVQRITGFAHTHVTEADNPIAIRQLRGLCAKALVRLDQREALSGDRVRHERGFQR